MTTGAHMILAERNRQIDVEGWTADHDDEHDLGQLATAGACYAANAEQFGRRHDPTCTIDNAPKAWPWDAEWWKPTTPIRMLVKAGALIAAEIDRRLRAGEAP